MPLGLDAEEMNTLRGDGFDCLLTLISIKMEHPRSLQVCTNVCMYNICKHRGPGVIRDSVTRFSTNFCLD